MGTDVRKHTAPLPGETPARQVINDLSLSINDVVPVANPTERQQKYDELVAAGQNPALRPVIVIQLDTRALWHNDGSGWRTLGAGAASPTTSAAGSLTTTGVDQLVPGASLTLGPGRWDVTAKGWADWSVGSGAPRYTIRLRKAGTEIDQVQVYIPGATNGAVPFHLKEIVDVPSGTVSVGLYGLATSWTAPGAAVMSACKIFATPVA